MGTKTMRFSNMENDIIVVTFSGDNVSDGELTPATSPVVLQMDGGGGEYSAVKYTTASISILCDGVQHLDLFAGNPLAVSVKIVNETTDYTLFLGYVTPNTFNQSLTGINDTLSIECVDCLGAAKYKPFKRINPSEGFPTSRISDLLLHEAIDLGAKLVVLPDYIQLLSGDGAKVTSNYQALEVSESYFYSSTTLPRKLPDGELSFDALAVTVYDIFEMVAQSFRASWVMYRDHIVLVDYIALSDAGELSASILPNGIAQKLSAKITLDEESVASGAANITILPRYSLVSLDNKECAGIKVHPDVFDDSLLFALRSSEVEEEVGRDETIYNLSQVLGSQASDTVAVFVPESTIPTSMFVAHKCVKDTDNGWIGGIEKEARWNDRLGGWDKYLRLFCPKSNAESKCLFSTKLDYRTAVVPSAFLGLKLSISAAFSDTAEKLYPTELKASGEQTLLIAIRCGDKYLRYPSTADKWGDERALQPLYFRQEGEWRTEFVHRGRGGLLCDNVPGGEIMLEIWVTSATTWRTCYIKELSLELTTDKAAALYLAREPETLYRGTYEYDKEMDTVSLPFRFGFPLGDKPFGTIIDGEEYAVTHGDSANRTVGCKMEFRTPTGVTYDMLERIERLANFGDGKQWEIPLCDAHNNFIPTHSAVSSPAWEGYKVIAGFERNISESTINVTLI